MEETSTAQTEQREAESTPQKNEGFDWLSTLPEFQDTESNAETVTETKKEEADVTQTAEEKEQAATEAANTETTTEEKKPETEEKTTEESSENKEEGFVTEEELKGTQTEPEDGTFKALAAELGYEIPAEFKEDFESFKQIHEAELAKVKESSLKEGAESVYASLKPEVRAAIELAQAYGDLSLEQIVRPTLEIDNFLKMSNEELVREEIKASHPNWTAEMIDTEMTLLGEKDGVLEHKANVIRKDLELSKTEIQETHNAKLKEYHSQAEQAKLQQRQGEIDQIKTVLDRETTFLDKKLTDTDKQYLLRELQAGYLEDLKNNPERLVKAMLYDKFGEKGLAHYKDRVLQSLREDLAKQQHNVPPTKVGNASKPVVTKPMSSQFDILNKEFGEKE